MCGIAVIKRKKQQETIWFNPLQHAQNASYFLPLSCSQGLADNAVISRVNGDLWDLDRPLEGDCSLELLRFDDEDAQAVRILSFLFMRKLSDFFFCFFNMCLVFLTL